MRCLCTIEGENATIAMFSEDGHYVMRKTTGYFLHFSSRLYFRPGILFIAKRQSKISSVKM